VRRLWAAVGGDPEDLDRLTVQPCPGLLPTAFRVGDLATAVVGTTLLAADGFRVDRGGSPEAVDVDEREAVASFASERLLRVDGRPLGSLWADLSGDYQTADGWVRLHCNFPGHREAALRALGEPGADRDGVAAAIAVRHAVEVETAVVTAGGAAAALRSRDQWLGSEPGRAAVAGAPVVTSPMAGLVGSGRSPGPRSDAPARPLVGVRVVELTRVIAGPVAGRVLAALGADVVHVRGPHLPTLPDLDLDTGFGKRSALLDLREPRDRRTFERLVSAADVVLQSYRPGALAGLGYDVTRLARLRPGLVVAQVSAYGPVGPWRQRRGFDSLVQMAGGIAEEGMRRVGADVPVPLPVQALDHGAGWLTALGVVQALRRGEPAAGWLVETSLARTAAWLDGLGRVEHPGAAGLPDVPLETVESAFGTLAHAPMPGRIGGARPTWSRPPAPPAPAAWLP
jgi:crotonobetainyl-CoA:carnitine CoA-transferase CaiB-like acyl-CoA transferase